jgi:hypothetical protein
MSRVNLVGIGYVGADVAPSLVKDLTSKFPDREFRVLNIVRDPLPKVDLILCRDLFVHLSNKDIQAAIKNVRSSGIWYLATATFTKRVGNRDLPFITRNAAWRTLNLELTPFKFPKPLFVLDEKCREGNGAFSDKAVAVWENPNLSQ